MMSNFIILGLLTLAGAIAAMSMRNLIHCALSLMIAFAGLAALYLQLDAQFVGFAQILVYIGAVAILIVFAILLTRGSEQPREAVVSRAALAGITVAVVVFGVLAASITRSSITHRELPVAPQATVRQLGDLLMSKYLLPLEVIGLLLTVALIGAVVIALHERSAK